MESSWSACALSSVHPNMVPVESVSMHFPFYVSSNIEGSHLEQSRGDPIESINQYPYQVGGVNRVLTGQTRTTLKLSDSQCLRASLIDYLGQVNSSSNPVGLYRGMKTLSIVVSITILVRLDILRGKSQHVIRGGRLGALKDLQRVYIPPHVNSNYIGRWQLNNYKLANVFFFIK